jgi:OTU domain-containing protein 5
MTEDVDRYITRKRHENTHGNHIEMIALAEIFNRPIEVYEYSTGQSFGFDWTLNGFWV